MYADLGVFADWSNTYREVVTPLGTEWGLGRITTSEVVRRLAAALGAEPRAVEQHFAQLQRAIRFFPRVVTAVRRRRDRGGRQALVTVNPADFGSILALHGLEELFDVVVVSGQEGLDDKPALAALAAERMGLRVEGTVLVDNIERNVTAADSPSARCLQQGSRTTGPERYPRWTIGPGANTDSAIWSTTVAR